MSAAIRKDYILVCDDIRQEIGRKPSAIGIYTDNIVVKGFPVVFPKLCFLVHLHKSDAVRKISISCTLRFSDGRKIVLAEKQIAGTMSRAGGIVLNFAVGPLRLDAPQRADFLLSVNGKRFRHSFSIEEAPDPKIFELN